MTTEWNPKLQLQTERGGGGGNPPTRVGCGSFDELPIDASEAVPAWFGIALPMFSPYCRRLLQRFPLARRREILSRLGFDELSCALLCARWDVYAEYSYRKNELEFLSEMHQWNSRKLGRLIDEIERKAAWRIIRHRAYLEDEANVLELTIAMDGAL